MGSYVNIGGSWRELKAGYANIGGSWRTIKEGYQLRNGVWEKVFPNYTDYGEEVDLFSDGRMTYGYWQYSSSSYPTLYTSSSTKSTSASNRRCYLSNMLDGDSLQYYGGAAYHWFPTQQPLDLRGYNYLAASYVIAHFDKTAVFTYYNDYVRPFFSVSTTSATSRPDQDTRYITGSQIQDSSSTSGSIRVYMFVDLTNCDLESAYLKVGGYLTSNYGEGTNAIYGWLTVPSSGEIYLYKNKSDCDIDPGSYNAVYLTY